MQQFFVTKVNDKFILDEDDLYHLSVVMRAREDTQIICIYNEEPYLCSFRYAGKNYDIKIITKMLRESELPVHIRLYQALIRNENFDFIIQKATELGVNEIVPTIFERNVVKIEKDKEEAKYKRYKLIAKGASDQSKRNVPPIILPQCTINNIELSQDEVGLVAYEKNENTKSLSFFAPDIKKAKKVSIIIGPEGGISEKEYQTLIQKGFRSISLGKRILRSETATISLLSVLSYIIEG